MDDLVATISGSMHVSQAGYNIKALQEYLAQTIILPNLPLSPSTLQNTPVPSRSQSSTRKYGAPPDTFYPEAASHPYSSPSLNDESYHHSTENVFMSGSTSRPGVIRRTSSYGSGGSRDCSPNGAYGTNGGVSVVPSSPVGYAGFESDAFAPLYQQTSSYSDPWRNRTSEESNPWAAFSGQSGAFGSRRINHGASDQYDDYSHRQDGQMQITRDEDEDEDEMMDADMAQLDTDEMEEEETVERVMGLDNGDGGVSGGYESVYGGWDRGRRQA